MAGTGRGEAPVQFGGAIADRYHHGQVQRGRPRPGTGVGQPGVGEPPREHGPGGRRDLARPQFRQRADAGGAQPQDPGRGSAKQHAGGEVLGVRVDDDRAAHRDACIGPDAQLTRPDHAGLATTGLATAHSASPPSTGITAPVIPLLPSPARKARTAATSSGRSSRPSGCWPANDPASGRW